MIFQDLLERFCRIVERKSDMSDAPFRLHSLHKRKTARFLCLFQPADENLYDTEGVYDTELLYDVLDSVYDTELPDEMYDSMDAGEGTEAEVAE